MIALVMIAAVAIPLSNPNIPNFIFKQESLLGELKNNRRIIFAGFLIFLILRVSALYS
jgi:hypothetical protein